MTVKEMGAARRMLGGLLSQGRGRRLLYEPESTGGGSIVMLLRQGPENRTAQAGAIACAGPNRKRPTWEEMPSQVPSSGAVRLLRR
jgi:hypothetical protein